MLMELLLFLLQAPLNAGKINLEPCLSFFFFFFFFFLFFNTRASVWMFLSSAPTEVIINTPPLDYLFGLSGKQICKLKLIPELFLFPPLKVQLVIKIQVQVLVEKHVCREKRTFYFKSYCLSLTTSYIKTKLPI